MTTIDAATMRRLTLHEARSTPCPGARSATSATRSCCTTRSIPSRSGTGSRPFAGRSDPAAFDRRLTETLVLFASLGRQPHVWPSPLHDTPADLVERLAANGFRDTGRGERDGPGRPRTVRGRGRASRWRRVSPIERLSGIRGRVADEAATAIVEVLVDAFDVGSERRLGRDGRDDQLARPTDVHPLPRPLGRPAGRGRPPGDVRRGQLPVVDRDRRLGARPGLRPARDRGRVERCGRRGQRVDAPRGLCRQPERRSGCTGTSASTGSASRARISCWSEVDGRTPAERVRQRVARRPVLPPPSCAARTRGRWPSGGPRSSSTARRPSSPTRSVSRAPRRSSPARRSDALGAACRVAAACLPDGGSLVVLEPDTEGRLAGSLARLGEGPVAVWLAVDEPGVRLEALREPGSSVSPERDGPFGAERLVLRPGGRHGRYRLLSFVAAGTIRP